MSTDETPPAGGTRARLLASVGYLLVALAVLAPALPEITSAFPGGPVAAVDGWQHVWHLWWAQRALAAGESPLVTPLLYYPDGTSLAVHPLSLSNGLLALPVTALLGPVAGYNLALLLAILLSGLGAYWLALHVCGRPGPAFVAGLIFAIAPYHLTKIWDGQLELIATQWLPLYALFLLRSVERPSSRDALIAGVFLAVVGYTSLYYLLFTAVFSAAFALIWLTWRAGRGARAALALRLGLTAGIGAVLLLPILLPILRGVGTGGPLAQGEPVIPMLVSRSANLLDFFLPSALHPLWGQAVLQFGPRWHPDISAWNVALGYTALALAALGCIWRWRDAWPWLTLALLGLLLALGPELNIGGLRTGMPMPYALLLGLPGMSLAQRPGHFVVITCLALVPLTAYGLGQVAARAHRPGIALAAAAALVIGESITLPLPLQRSDVPPAYAQLAGRPGALLILPAQEDTSFSLRGQMVHGRPIIGGYLARAFPNSFAERVPGIRQLWRMRPESLGLALAVGDDASATLRAFGVSQVVVNWDRLQPDQRVGAAAALAEALPDVLPVNTGAVSIYDVPVGRPAQPFAFFGAGWYAEERDGGRRWRWMPGEANLALINPAPRAAAFRLNLRAEAYASPRQVALSLDGHTISVWDVPTQPDSANTTLSLLLPPGEHTLGLRAPATPETAHRGPLSIVITAISLTAP
ncbi:MAG: hypothetical protein WCJ55_15325 [Chloroflexales bacterium]